MLDHPLGHGPSPEGHRVRRFSFWKPEPIPPRNATVFSVKLHSLGKIDGVTRRLADVPRMTEILLPPLTLWEAVTGAPTKRLRWQVDEGVILQVKTEQGPLKPGEVLTIAAASAAPDKTFYRLYVQIFEQFGATVLDEHTRNFLTPREFRRRLAN